MADDRREGTDSNDERMAPAGEDAPGRGRPTGVAEDARKDAEGRPTVVREARPETPPSHTQPTEGAVDRGQTPDTEVDPGQDL